MSNTHLRAMRTTLAAVLVASAAMAAVAVTPASADDNMQKRRPEKQCETLNEAVGTVMSYGYRVCLTTAADERAGGMARPTGLYRGTDETEAG